MSRCMYFVPALAAGFAVLMMVSLASTADESRDAFPVTAGAEPVVVPTFNCFSIYWSPQGGGADRTCAVRYRVAGTRAWREALPLWFDARNGEYRGSIVNLTPDTRYEIELRLNGAARTLTAHTWSERFPVAKTIRLPENSSRTLVIDQSGTPNGYILYTPEKGKTRDRRRERRGRRVRADQSLPCDPAGRDPEAGGRQRYQHRRRLA